MGVTPLRVLVTRVMRPALAFHTPQHRMATGRPQDLGMPPAHMMTGQWPARQQHSLMWCLRHLFRFKFLMLYFLMLYLCVAAVPPLLHAATMLITMLYVRHLGSLLTSG